MIKYLIAVVFLFLASCNSNKAERVEEQGIKEESFELFKAKEQKGTLVLFPGFGGGGAENTKSEFKILEIAAKNNISVLLMDFDHHVFLKEEEKESLKKDLESIFNQYKLKHENIYIGGFSAGGNVSLLLSDYLIKTKSNIIPKGVFIVDSPIDLLKIYEVSEKNIRNNVDAESVEEAKWIVENFNADFGNPKKGIKKYELNSPFTSKTANISNLDYLKDTKIRLYTEPDLLWWKKQNGNDYEDLNAFSIEKMAEEMKKKQFSDVNVIITKNKGYRANGEKHPHSWSIVDQNNLMSWMLDK
ncbi:steryl acetyl hydrolase [Flavobacterium amniphilum]|uniref:steryl acetyl hydrolase n=1 Tax=Flavobacterium amniphilum TaxID=1834035 RepID=UPI002029F46E|nr:steryl acetyl hydrolase [Flavobacterium amniphilum]MCL9805380.1 steryl acetyl hydrolase [Flavobacterium amniphilum]